MKLTVALLDNSRELEPSLKAAYRDIFKLIGYTPQFIYRNDQDALLRLLSSRSVNVVICDLALGDSRNFRGLQLAHAIKLGWPHIVCIGNSASDPGHRTMASKLPNFDLFISKQDLHKRTHFDQFAKIIERLLVQNTSVMVDESSILGSRFKSAVDPELVALINQVTFTAHSCDSTTRINRVILTPLSGGRSGSDVFNFQAYAGTQNMSCVPAVLKISDRTRAEKELANYHQFVKWTLPYTWRVDILGTGNTEKNGAICYSFILSGDEPFDTLTHYLESRNDRIITEVIKGIFSPRAQRWYAPECLELHDNLIKRYSQRYFPYGTDYEQDIFNEDVQKFFQAVVSNKITMENQDYPLPVEELFGRFNTPQAHYWSCICHGDLNSNNIIVSQKGQRIFIDFQDTGRGHVFEDFIALEASIRLHYLTGTCTAHDYLKAETDLIKGAKFTVADQGYQHMRLIRRLAKANFPDEPNVNYLYGAAVYNFRLLRIQNLTPTQRMRIMAAILANMKAFNELK